MCIVLNKINNFRCLLPSHAAIDALDVETVRRAVRKQLSNTRAMEVSVCGDLPVARMEELALSYLGTVPEVPALTKDSAAAPVIAEGSEVVALSEVQEALGTTSSTTIAMPAGEEGMLKELGEVAKVKVGEGRDLTVQIQDSEERAMGYLVGAAPNEWGVFSDGSTIADRYNQQNTATATATAGASGTAGVSGSASTSVAPSSYYFGSAASSTATDRERRAHPMHGNVVLQILKEVGVS
jgi:hypothetical protein